MARYEDDFYRDSYRGFPPPGRDAGRGMDPNYAARGYGGARMEPGDRFHAAYGRYRAQHARDLSGYGGPKSDGEAPREQEAGFEHQREPQRDFNANTSTPGHGGPPRGPVPRRSFGRPEEVNRERPVEGTDAGRNLREDDGFGRYTGYNSGGFAEPWLPYDPSGVKDAPT